MTRPGRTHDETRPGMTRPGPAWRGTRVSQRFSPPSAAFRLLDGDGGAGALQGRPCLVRALLVDLLQYRLGRAVHQILGLLEAQAGQAAHLLDDLDLLVAGRLEDDVELVLLLGLLGLAGTGPAGGRGGHRHGGGRLHVERLLELLHEIGELEQGHLLERLEEVVSADLRHGGVFLVPSIPSVWGRVSLRRPARPARRGCRPRGRWVLRRWVLRRRLRRSRAWRAAPRRAGPSAPAAR